MLVDPSERLVMADYYLFGLSPQVMACTRELYSLANSTVPDQWLFVTNEVLYYLLPVVLGLALVFTLLSSIVTAKMVTDSHECYITGFNISSFVLILMAAVVHLPAYVPLDGSDEYYKYASIATPYLYVVENWCFYSCTWLLMTAVIERAGHALCGRWHSSFGKIHGILASLLIVVVCFVCTLPQYWEYENAVVYEERDGYNCSKMVISPIDNIVEHSGGYVSEYYYYHWVLMIFSIALPYLCLPIMLPPMCCIKMHTYSALSANGHISTYVDDYVSKDYMKDEKSFNRTLSVIVMLYLILSGPRNAVKLFHNPPFFMNVCSSTLMSDTLVILFDLLFYSMFLILFLFNLCCCAKFRRSLKSLRSRCCSRTHD